MILTTIQVSQLYLEYLARFSILTMIGHQVRQQLQTWRSTQAPPSGTPPPSPPWTPSTSPALSTPLRRSTPALPVGSAACWPGRLASAKILKNIFVFSLQNISSHLTLDYKLSYYKSVSLTPWMSLPAASGLGNLTKFLPTRTGKGLGNKVYTVVPPYNKLFCIQGS